jgi:hypothetical protein
MELSSNRFASSLEGGVLRAIALFPKPQQEPQRRLKENAKKTQKLQIEAQSLAQFLLIAPIDLLSPHLT